MCISSAEGDTAATCMLLSRGEVPWGWLVDDEESCESTQNACRMPGGLEKEGTKHHTASP